MMFKNNPAKNKENVLNVSNENLFEAIKKRAYELYCRRGKNNGNDLNDWLAAERQVKKELGLKG